jgi:ATP-binding cassette subfamily F protein 3
MDEYRVLLAERARPAGKADAAGRRENRRERAEARAALAPLRRQARDAEARIAKLARERAALEARLADPSAYAVGKADEITATNTRLAAIERETAAAEATWMAAEAALESAEV